MMWIVKFWRRWRMRREAARQIHYMRQVMDDCGMPSIAQMEADIAAARGFFARSVEKIAGGGR